MPNLLYCCIVENKIMHIDRILLIVIIITAYNTNFLNYNQYHIIWDFLKESSVEKNPNFSYNNDQFDHRICHIRQEHKTPPDFHIPFVIDKKIV